MYCGRCMQRWNISVLAQASGSARRTTKTTQKPGPDRALDICVPRAPVRRGVLPSPPDGGRQHTVDSAKHAAKGCTGSSSPSRHPTLDSPSSDAASACLAPSDPGPFQGYPGTSPGPSHPLVLASFHRYTHTPYSFLLHSLSLSLADLHVTTPHYWVPLRSGVPAHNLPRDRRSRTSAFSSLHLRVRSRAALSPLTLSPYATR